MTIAVLTREDVRHFLTFKRCIPAVREAMVALSAGATQQTLRQIVPIDKRGMFGVMQGALGPGASFGAKVLSVFPGQVDKGGQSHQGVIVLFDRETGAPSHLMPAGEITAIRTAAASAVASDALARPDARRLAILGTGEQAKSHALAICEVRSIEEIVIWGRSDAKARALATALAATLRQPITTASTATLAVKQADIICTTTAASEPLLAGADVSEGAHLNLVGSSYLGPREVDDALVARGRYFADHRASVLSQGAELASCIRAGLVDENHLLAEIGEVLAGAATGRTSDQDITIYKSLGNIVQDLAAASVVAALVGGVTIDLDLGWPLHSV